MKRSKPLKGKYLVLLPDVDIGEAEIKRLWDINSVN